MGVTEDIVDVLDDYVYEHMKKKVLAYALVTLKLSPGGFWAYLVTKVLTLIIDKLVIPALKDLKEEGFLFLRKKDLEKKVKKYLESETEDEFDQNFDDLINRR